MASPTTDISHLRSRHVGRYLHDLDDSALPAAVIDVAVARRNCALMREAADRIGVVFRPHVKSHKTTELTRCQVNGGDSDAGAATSSDPVRLVVSTVAEIQYLVPYLLECKSNGRSIDVILGLPIPPSALNRIAALLAILGPHSISLILDCAESLSVLSSWHASTHPPPQTGLFIKLDTGYNRCGVPPDSAELTHLLTQLRSVETTSSGGLYFRGFYSHMGSSYGADSCVQSLRDLHRELAGSEAAVRQAGEVFGAASGRRIVVSVGATPTATSIQELFSPPAEEARHSTDETKRDSDTDGPGLSTTTKTAVRDIIARLARSDNSLVEFHAGAYVLLDMQQLATHARSSGLQFSDVAISVLTEVASVYLRRRPGPEAFMPCGKLSLGYDTCKSYGGMGIVMPWRDRQYHPDAAGYESGDFYDPDGARRGWIAHRLSQEHGILRWMERDGDATTGDGSSEIRSLRVGERVRIVPNHCCMCVANFDYVFVVDSAAGGNGDDDVDSLEKGKIRDVWVSWRGW